MKSNFSRYSNNIRRQSLSYSRSSQQGRDGKELIQCPTNGCNGMGHMSGNYATHRRQDNKSLFDYVHSLKIICFYKDITNRQLLITPSPLFFLHKCINLNICFDLLLVFTYIQVTSYEFFFKRHFQYYFCFYVYMFCFF